MRQLSGSDRFCGTGGLLLRRAVAVLKRRMGV